jgi:hypothetical protein
MNEIIKELALQAGAHISTRNLMSNPPQHIETMELWDDRIEKFADLIVRECIGVIENKMPDFTCKEDYENLIRKAGRMDAIDEIKEHFGVEE